MTTSVSASRGKKNLPELCGTWERKLRRQVSLLRKSVIELGAKPDEAIEPLDPGALVFGLTDVREEVRRRRDVDHDARDELAPGGRIHLGCERVGECICFSVRDTGIGIAPEDQERVFAEFHQVEVPGQAQPVGTGLGLTIAKRNVELNGGTIALASPSGGGLCGRTRSRPGAL